MSEKTNEKLSILSKLFPDYDFQERKLEFCTWCPKHDHHKKKLQVSLEKDNFHCWVCGYSGHVLKLIRENFSYVDVKNYGDLLPRQESRCFNIAVVGENELKLPDSYKFLLGNEKTPEGRASIKILREFGCDNNEIILQNKIGYCTEGDFAARLIYPSFDRSGKLNYYVGRSFYDFGKKYLNCDGVKTKDIVFNSINIIWSRPIVLVEGIKSALKHSAIPNMVPILGSQIRKDYKILEEIIYNGCGKVFVAFDQDARVKSYEAMKLFNEYGIKVKLVDIQDQPDKMSTKDFVLAIKNSKDFTIDDYLKEKIMEI